LDCPLPKLCLAVTLSHQDGHHSAVALLLKAALIQVSQWLFYQSLVPIEQLTGSRQENLYVNFP
jgi:hypothetical protein